MNSIFEATLKNDKLYFSKTLYLFIIGGLIGVIAYAEFTNDQVRLIGYSLSAIIVLLGVMSVNDFVSIEYTGREIILNKRVLGKTVQSHYRVEDITNLKLRLYVKSSFYTSSANVKVMGMDVTPESMKNYYYHKELISFEVGKQKVEIGKWKKAFNAKKLYKLLNGKTK